MKILLFFIMLTASLAAKPQEPYTLILDKNKIQPIALHSEISTLLVFPDEVTTLLGNGLTSGGNVKGSVLYQQGEVNTKTIVLKHLDDSTKVLMTVMIGDNAYVFRLEPSTSPASVIYLQKTAVSEKAKKITQTQALLRKRFISKERQLELLRLARDAKTLRTKIPQEYATYSEKAAVYSHSKHGIKTSTTLISKFNDDKSLVLTGTIHNASNQTLNIQHYIGTILIGKNHSISPTLLRADKKILSPNTTAKFEALIIDSSLSIDNSFKLQLTKTR